ncbi:hypothetical protein HDV00_003715, partial [Rhizophlyctis rosea]
MSEEGDDNRSAYGTTSSENILPSSVVVNVDEFNPERELKHRGAKLRLKKSVQTLMNARRFTGSISDPGLDVGVSHPQLEASFKADVTITAADFSASRLEISNLNMSDFGAYLKKERPSWAAVSIKSDWYENHLYVSMHLVSLEDGKPSRALFPNRPEISFMKGLKKVYIDRPAVTVEQANFFLTRDGTVLSIFQHEGQKVTEPIISRLHREGTLLRESEDASFLLFTLIDATVDHTFPVVTAYGSVLEVLEERVFTEPRAEYTQELHLMAKELCILKRMLAPTQYLIQTLQRENGKFSKGKDGGNGKEMKIKFVEGDLVSELTKTYLRDVTDHITTILENLGGYVDDARNLIDLIFNTISWSTNESMKTLALVSIIFLPISFLAGVFGTNFEDFP